MDYTFYLAVLAAAVTAGTPILYAALGELLAERSGVLNLGVEGMMLVGAIVGFIIAVNTANPWLGVGGAMLASGALALIHAFLTITLQANQVVSGLALTMFGAGFSSFIGRPFVGIAAPVSFQNIPIPILSQIPYLGDIFFRHDPLVYLTYILAPLMWFLLYWTRPGLNIQAVGEDPAAADAVGINVKLVRYLCVITGGMFAGLGGAYLTLAFAPLWLDGMTAGRGWIAIALVIFAVWNPLKAIAGAYLFGGVAAMSFRMQILEIPVSPFFLQMMPYLFTIMVLIIVTIQASVKRIGAPKALGLAYDREDR
ncbi:MAG TPA: ABC transporter permease [Candidatus Limnocylindrales bacterium]|nr:ABC transporter permease [Candidatus Limnocylindrales bacterium]